VGAGEKASAEQEGTMTATTTTLLPREEIVEIIAEERVGTIAQIAWDAAGPHHDGVATIDLTDGVIWGRSLGQGDRLREEEIVIARCPRQIAAGDDGLYLLGDILAEDEADALARALGVAHSELTRADAAEWLPEEAGETLDERRAHAWVERHEDAGLDWRQLRADLDEAYLLLAR